MNSGLEYKDGAGSSNGNNDKSNSGTQGSGGSGTNNKNKKPCDHCGMKHSKHCWKKFKAKKGAQNNDSSSDTGTSLDSSLGPPSWVTDAPSGD